MHADKPSLLETKLLRMIDEGQQLRFTSADPEGAQLLLSRQSIGGNGLLVEFAVGGEPASAWIADTAWCDWLLPRLCIQSFADTPQDLLPVVGQWAFGPLHACLDTLSLGPVEFISARAGRCAPRAAPVLALVNGDRSLPLRVVEWPVHSMESLIGRMTDVTSLVGAAPTRGRMTAGWVHLRRGELAGLRQGDILILDEEARIEHNEAWLMVDELAVKVRCVDNAASDMRDATAWEIVSIAPRPVTHPENPVSDGPVTAVADLGDAVILPHTGPLCCGERIRMQLTPAAVSLRGLGDLDLLGQLVRLDDALALRIA
ncbi:hypothetical protein [Cupriavidus pampae]|uniref:YscQ/HrcQ family type III secretion apparatus protein n=1 Tax=Cupriavidus pampae TaxID=659251 RepID=A0ABN7ZIW0_9BURK|nr:hypothetical protein [Cupriavidus pampae]CAG9185927.1 hypothetical protein LMG32289_06165 [Cupriavidus pampae]